jgi:DNA replication protein DnaC
MTQSSGTIPDHVTAASALAPDSDTQAIKQLEQLRDQARAALPPAPKRADFSQTMARLEAPSEERDRQVEHLRIRQDAQNKAIARRAALSSLETGAGSRYAHCRLANFHVYEDGQARVVAAVREYLETMADRTAACEGLIFYGPVGTGKDHLAYAVCHGALRTIESVGWINGQSWFGRIRDNMESGKPEAAAISDLARPALLCLSDPLPPSGSLTQHQTTMLYRLVDSRYSNGKPTIVTVNVKDDLEADERMGAATWDRLCHGAWKAHCNWPTHRKPAREI